LSARRHGRSGVHDDCNGGRGPRNGRDRDSGALCAHRPGARLGAGRPQGIGRGGGLRAGQYLQPDGALSQPAGRRGGGRGRAAPGRAGAFRRGEPRPRAGAPGAGRGAAPDAGGGGAVLAGAGEDQILAQIRSAAEAAQACGAMDAALSTLFRLAQTCGKRIRSELRFVRADASVAERAIREAEARLGGLAGRQAPGHRRRRHGHAHDGRAPRPRVPRDGGAPHPPAQGRRRGGRRAVRAL
jgi:hypothetical protein